MQECLCALVIDNDEEVSTAAQEFLEHSFSSNGKKQLEQDVAEIFSRFESLIWFIKLCVL